MSSPLPHAVKKSSTSSGRAASGGNNGGGGGAEATTPQPAQSSSSQSEAVKEKEQVKLSPLHQALMECVEARPGKLFSRHRCRS